MLLDPWKELPMRWLMLPLAVMLAGPAMAQGAPSDALLKCPTMGVTPAFREQLADAMLRSSATDDALFEQLVDVTQECATRFGLAEDKGEAYFTYSLAQLPRETLVARLKAAGIAASSIDDGLGFGEGRANPVISADFSAEQMAGLLAALTSSGVDVETIPDASWEIVGAYAATSSLMWQARRKLQ